MIYRQLQPKIKKALNEKMVAIVYGARQTGKTTLSKQIGESYNNTLYLSCDDPSVVSNLTERSAVELKAYIGNADLVIIDEAQRVQNIGIAIKLLHDTYPEVHLLVTGSSSLDLSNKVSEPLTGRSVEFILYPLSVTEISKNSAEIETNGRILMIRGGYPGMWELPTEDAQQRLINIAHNYLYRDAFSPLVIYDQTILNSLLVLLAYQIGNEVSYSELAQKISVSGDTIKRYIDLLEKAFIVFRLNQYRKNKRSEVGKLRKIYFYDLGIRNALINNFSPLETRDDVGMLWENYAILERRKYLETTNVNIKYYYWRNRNQREIDYIEEQGTNVSAYELKWSNKRPKVPLEFERDYPEALYTIVNPRNFDTKLLEGGSPGQIRLLP